MAIFIQNSLSKKKEEFIPASVKEVKMYTCGVTVYDDCHVGHARSLCIFDGLKRYM
jgi:cysteinyl-tRNA synthetase